MSLDSRLLRGALVGALAVGVVACGDGPVVGPDPGLVDPALADVLLEGGASGHALERLVASAAIVDPARAAVIDSPSNDVTLAPHPIPTFAWHTAGEAEAPRWAGHLLVFSTDADPELLRVFTAKTTYLPDDAAWATL